MKYLRLFENLSDKVKPGDYVYYLNTSEPNFMPFILEVVEYSHEEYIKVHLICYKENGEWKLCKDNPNMKLLLFDYEQSKEKFNQYGRLPTPEEFEEIDYLINARNYNL